MLAVNSIETATLNTDCTHLSTKLSSFLLPASLYLHQLNAREQQVAHLVAQGFTNTQIGTELWITRNTVKQSLKKKTPV